MIDLEYIRSFFPPMIARESRFDRYMLKEYLQLLILDHIILWWYEPSTYSGNRPILVRFGLRL